MHGRFQACDKQNVVCLAHGGEGGILRDGWESRSVRQTKRRIDDPAQWLAGDGRGAMSRLVKTESVLKALWLMQAIGEGLLDKKVRGVGVRSVNLESGPCG